MISETCKMVEAMIQTLMITDSLKENIYSGIRVATLKGSKHIDLCIGGTLQLYDDINQYFAPKGYELYPYDGTFKVIKITWNDCTH